MTNAAILWVEKELGILKADAPALETSVLAWAHNFLSAITPVVRQAATDAVIAFVTLPGTGAVKFAGAVAAATADLVAKGVPVVDGQIKAAVQIAYEALPDDLKATSAATAVVNAADNAIDKEAAAVIGTELPAPASAPTA